MGAMIVGKGRITEYHLLDGQRFPTQWGMLTFRQWCEREVERIRRRGTWVRVNELVDGTGAIVYETAIEP